MRLDDPVVIVTGGAGGLGSYYCRHLVQEGARVVVADVHFAEAHALEEQLDLPAGGRRAVEVIADVTSEAGARQMVEAAIEAFGRVDVLLNNVGTYPHVSFEDITYEAWRQVMAVNLDSVFLCSKAVLPVMKNQSSGKIINVATNLVWIGLAGMVHYVAAKAGVVGFTRSLARELGDYGITVNALAPGAVTPPVESLDAASIERLESIVRYQSVKWCERPVDLLGAVLFLVSSDSDFMSGQVLTVDGGLTTH